MRVPPMREVVRLGPELKESPRTGPRNTTPGRGKEWENWLGTWEGNLGRFFLRKIRAGNIFSGGEGSMKDFAVDFGVGKI